MLICWWFNSVHFTARLSLDKTDFFTFWQRIVLIWVNDFTMNISLFLYWIFCLQAGHLNFIDSVGASKYCFNCYNQPFIVVISSISSDPARSKLLETARPEWLRTSLNVCLWKMSKFPRKYLIDSYFDTEDIKALWNTAVWDLQIFRNATPTGWEASWPKIIYL